MEVVNPSLLSSREETMTLDGCIGRVGYVRQGSELVKGGMVVLLVIPKTVLSLLPNEKGGGGRCYLVIVPWSLPR